MKPFHIPWAFALGLLTVSSAWAQWTVSTSAGLQHTELQEYAPDGRELVREHGWMPGLGVRAEYAWQAWRFGIGGSTYRKTIVYDGHLQNGAPFASNTDATQDRLNIDMAYRISDAASLIGGIEWEHRNRRILGQATVGGLDERSTSWRLLGGGQLQLAQSDTAAVNAKALLVVSQAEQLHVCFDQRLFDDASFSTKPATGLRTAITVMPRSLPRFSTTVEFEWIKVPRSDEAALRKNGSQEGTVTQPEHQRRTVSAYVTYRFD